MIILAIETSCDETGAAVVKDGTEILSNVVASSQALHVKTGGIIPENAAREQIKSILPVIEEALKNPGLDKNDIDAIAVTIGPGLIGSLLVGVETAKTLSYLWNKPLIPVNHMVGHIYANWLIQRTDNIQHTTYNKVESPEFPLLALVVSGGHTDLVFMKKHPSAASTKGGQAGQAINYLGGTRDDAAGEAFDKIARILGLPYPGGPAIAASAAEHTTHNNTNIKLELFPRPMIDSNNYDFSFSGLKTAVNRLVNTTKNKGHKEYNTERLAAEVQAAIVETLVNKTMNAVAEYKPKSLLISGGVAANRFLRDSFAEEISRFGYKTSLHVPVPSLCTDNAAMIGAAAFYNNEPIEWKSIKANPELTIKDSSVL